MKLILTGGGESRHFKTLDQKFISLLGANPSLLFIPLAGDEEHWDDGLTRIMATFSTIKFDNIEMCLDLDSLDWEYLQHFDAIYIDGGNTFQLMSKIRQNHTFELLHRFLHNGGVINGDSAGAIVLGSHLETAHFGEDGDDNETELISYQGLNLLGDVAVHCHYEESEKQQIAGFVEEYGFPVVALGETTGVSIENGLLKVIGHSKADVYFLDKIIELQPGDTLRLLNN